MVGDCKSRKLTLSAAGLVFGFKNEFIELKDVKGLIGKGLFLKFNFPEIFWTVIIGL